MNILGLSFWPGGHDSSAAIVCDGRLVATAEEERFTRIKHDGGPPVNAIDFCLEHTALRMAEIDAIAFAGLPFRFGADSNLAELDWSFTRRLLDERLLRRRAVINKGLTAIIRSLGGARRMNLGMNSGIAGFFTDLGRRHGRLPPIKYFGHHLCHAAAAYYTSPLEAAAVATIDGRGAWFSSVTWKAQGPQILPLRAEPFSNSLGFFYSQCTEYIGLGEFGEGKTMGLASYGNPEAQSAVANALLQLGGRDWYLYRQAPCPEVVGFPPRTSESVLEPPFADFAAACQHQLQEAVGRVVTSVTQSAGTRNVCLGGGVTLNCTSNGALLASHAAATVNLFPATGDDGLATGAALLCAAQTNTLSRESLQTAYLGPEFTPSQCEAALQMERRVSFHRPADLAGETAGLIASGNIIGWFQGRMEVGPRALGNRSILADPRSTAVRDSVNLRKGREAWRPLAPAVLAERTTEYFDLNTLSPFMLLACQVRRAKRALIPGVVHVDGSARPQTVRYEQNPRFYDLIGAFERRTGIPVVMNTSFNAADEPIVCTPADAVRTFLRTELDALVLGDFVVQRR